MSNMRVFIISQLLCSPIIDFFPPQPCTKNCRRPFLDAWRLSLRLHAWSLENSRVLRWRDHLEPKNETFIRFISKPKSSIGKKIFKLDIFFHPLKNSQKLQLSATLGEIYKKKINVFNYFSFLTLINSYKLSNFL